MCIHPKVINRSNRLAGLTRPAGLVYVPQPNGDFFTSQYRLDRVHGFKSDQIIVPCGKCLECVKKRQNDLSTRTAREAAYRGSFFFVTLTYNDESLPVSVRLCQVVKDTGEVLYPYECEQLVRLQRREDAQTVELVKDVRGELLRLAPSPSARVVTRPFFEDDEFLYYYEFTPSINRRDLRLWLKRCRVKYKRMFGRPLSEFSYVATGEYGPKTARPHYHICLLGLSEHEVSWMANEWTYGFTNVKKVNAVNPDGSNGFEIAGKYVGKYVTKGKFECDSVKCGIAQKPRLLLSKGVGFEQKDIVGYRRLNTSQKTWFPVYKCTLPDSLISYYRCYDLYGKYDINSLVDPSTGKRFTDSKLLEMAAEISKRSRITVGRSEYALPHNYLLHLWYVYDDIKKCYRASELRLQMSALTRVDPVADYISQLRQDYPAITAGEISSKVSEFVECRFHDSDAREARADDSLRAFYSSSIF